MPPWVEPDDGLVEGFSSHSAEQTVPGRHSKKIEALASLYNTKGTLDPHGVLKARTRAPPLPEIGSSIAKSSKRPPHSRSMPELGRTDVASQQLPTEHGRELLQPLKPPALPKRLAALPPGPLGAQFDASPVRFDGTTAEKVQQEVDMQGQMQRRLQLQLKQSHAALAQERLQTVRAKKLGDHALAQAERSQEQALEQARVQREAAEKRLARQMGAQRRMLEKDMEQMHATQKTVEEKVKEAAESAAKGRRALLERLREKDEQLREAHAELERARDRVRRGVCEHSRMNAGHAVLFPSPPPVCFLPLFPSLPCITSHPRSPRTLRLPPHYPDRYKRRLSTPTAPLCAGGGRARSQRAKAQRADECEAGGGEGTDRRRG